MEAKLNRIVQLKLKFAGVGELSRLSFYFLI